MNPADPIVTPPDSALPDPEALAVHERRRRRALALGAGTAIAVANAIFWGIGFATRWPLEETALAAAAVGAMAGAGLWWLLAPPPWATEEAAEAPSEEELASLKLTLVEEEGSAAPADPPTKEERAELRAEWARERAAHRWARIRRGLPVSVGVGVTLSAWALFARWLPVDWALHFGMSPGVLCGLVLHFALRARSAETTSDA